MRRRRALGAALGIAAVVATVVPLALHARASGPSSASVPDFTNSPPVQQTAPSPWDFEVLTGGLSAGQQVTFTFLYNGKLGDRDHSVNFPLIDPTSGGQLSQSITVSTLPAPPPGVPVSPVQTQQCLTAGSISHPSLIQVDPYAQTITVTMHDPEAAGSLLVFCMQPTSGGLVGFPTSTTSPNDPTSQYSIQYTEPGGSTSATYSVAGQNPTSPTTAVVRVLDSGGTDLTNRGLDGTRPLVFGVTYDVSLHGQKAVQYQVQGSATDASSNIADNSQPVVTGTASFGTCSAGPGYLCTDNNGDAAGTLVLHSSNPDPDYVGLTSTVAGAFSSSQTAENVISVTIGPAGAGPPQPGSVGTPTPLPSGATPAPIISDPNCTNPLSSASGLGSRDVLDAAEQVLIPDATAICSSLSGAFSYTGINDQVGIDSALGNETYAFAGLDRSLTASEYAMYTAPGGNGGGVEQFPIFTEPIVVTYNLPQDAPGCATSRVNLRSQVLSLIFMGELNPPTWNNSLIVQDNNGLSGCNLPVLVAHDIGQASSVFKDYLSKRNPQWAPYKQSQLADAWPSQSPVSCTANGSRAMALCVAGQPGMIGYGYYRFIAQAALPIAGVDNASGTSSTDPTKPGLGFQSSPLDPNVGCQAAASNNPNEPANTNQDWSNASLTDPPTGYPICAFDFVVAHRQCGARISYGGLRAFLGAVYLPSVQDDLSAHGFAPLPSNVIQTAQSGIGNAQTVPNPAPLQC